MTPAPLVGVLALQGGFAAHVRVLRSLGAEVREVRVAGATSTASTGSSCPAASRPR